MSLDCYRPHIDECCLANDNYQKYHEMRCRQQQIAGTREGNDECPDVHSIDFQFLSLSLSRKYFSISVRFLEQRNGRFLIQTRNVSLAELMLITKCIDVWEEQRRICGAIC
jgi:hypothetical protein